MARERCRIKLNDVRRSLREKPKNDLNKECFCIDCHMGKNAGP